MIITENLTINGRAFIRTYSDANRYVMRDGISYSEAIDPAEYGRTYTEGEIMETDEQTEQKVLAYDIIMGVSE